MNELPMPPLNCHPTIAAISSALRGAFSYISARTCDHTEPDDQPTRHEQVAQELADELKAAMEALNEINAGKLSYCYGWLSAYGNLLLDDPGDQRFDLLKFLVPVNTEPGKANAASRVIAELRGGKFHRLLFKYQLYPHQPSGPVYSGTYHWDAITPQDQARVDNVETEQPKTNPYWRTAPGHPDDPVILRVFFTNYETSFTMARCVAENVVRESYLKNRMDAGKRDFYHIFVPDVLKPANGTGLADQQDKALATTAFESHHVIGMSIMEMKPPHVCNLNERQLAAMEKMADAMEKESRIHDEGEEWRKGGDKGATMANSDERWATLQQLSDCGLNPFAVQLFWESWRNLPNPEKVSFPFRGTIITIEPLPAPPGGHAVVPITPSDYCKWMCARCGARSSDREYFTSTSCPGQPDCVGGA